MRFVTLLASVVISFPTAGCTGSGPDAAETISRDEFVQAYFALRRAGLRSPGMDLTLDARDSVLAHLELTEADLLTFAEVWGAEGEVMLSVWEEVDSLMQATRSYQGEEPGEGADDPGGEETGSYEPGGEAGDRREAGSP